MIRNAEPCRVIHVEYVINNDALSSTKAIISLILEDNLHPGPVQGRTFCVELPPTHLGQADFIIPELRFCKSAEQDFRVGQRCKVGCCFECIH